MEQEWVCIYCKNPNPYNARYCSHCNAKIPNLRQSFLAEAEEEDKKDEEEKTSEQEELFPIPRPGDMTGPLYNLAAMVSSKEISLGQFGDALRTSLDNLESAFDEIYSDVESIDTEVADYRSEVVALLENVNFMFNKGLEEMLLFEEDSDASHLRFGKILVQRAEMEYIQVLEMLMRDASMNPFEGAPNVVGDLARRYFDGEINQEAFKEQVGEFEKVAMESFENSRKMIDEAFKLAKNFEGTGEEDISRAIDKLTDAGNELSKIIINLHTQDEIKGAFVEILDENVDEKTLQALSKTAES